MVEALDHHLDHSDAIIFGRAAALPHTLSRGPQKARGAAELTRQLFEEPIEPFLTDGPSFAGFMIFIVASIAWMIDGWLETKASLVIQNVILLVINAIGVWRWFPKAENEAKS